VLARARLAHEKSPTHAFLHRLRGDESVVERCAYCDFSVSAAARVGAAGLRGARVRPAEANDDRATARVPAALTRPEIGSGTGRPRILRPRPMSRPRTIDSPTQQAMAIRMASAVATTSSPDRGIAKGLI
jgi:hypothetical protein